MKKTMIKILLAGALLVFVSAPAFAAQVDCDGTFQDPACDHIDDSTGGGSGITLRLSPNVTIAYFGAATAYNAASWNKQGTKGYGASSASQGLFVTKADYDINLLSDLEGILPSDASGEFDTSSDWSVVGK